MTAVCAVSTGLVLVAMGLVSLHAVLGQMERQAETAFEGNLNAVFLYLRGRSVIDHMWLSQTETAEGLLIRVDRGGRELLFTGQNSLRERMTGRAVEAAREEYGFDFAKTPSGTFQPDVVTFQLEGEGTRYRAAVAALPSGDAWYNVAVLKDMGPQREQERRLRLLFGVCVALALLCLSAVAWGFTLWAVRPVRENQRRQSEFISAAGHELRSPLAVIRAAAGTLRTAPSGKAERFAGLIEGECERLGRLTDDLLCLAGADGGRLSLTLSPTEPETLLLAAAERYEPVARQKGVHIAVGLPPEALPRLICDEQRVQQVMSALLDNAIRYTPEGGVIRCGVRSGGKSVRFWVADSGSGIPDSEKERVFERFYRGDQARTGKGHYGLGLSVAREIARLHRGSLILRDSQEGGAEFILRLPLHGHTG